MPWTLLLDDVGRSGGENMAIDESLLHAADRAGTCTLRLYAWDPPCLSFGRNEPALARYDRAKIEQLGLDVVRRPTGGRAVWHEHEVTYAVAAPVAVFGVQASLRESYRLIHERLAAALCALGAPAELGLERPAIRPADGPSSCFALPVGGEIMVKGKKVVGSALVRHGDAFLQHGSILLDGAQERIAAVSYQPSAIGSATTLSAVLGRPVSFHEVAAAIIEAWDQNAPLATPSPRPPSPAVARLSRFSDPSWTWRR